MQAESHYLHYFYLFAINCPLDINFFTLVIFNLYIELPLFQQKNHRRYAFFLVPHDLYNLLALNISPMNEVKHVLLLFSDFTEKQSDVQ